MEENKEELRLRKCLTVWMALCGRWRTATARWKNRLRRMRRECVWSAPAVKRIDKVEKQIMVVNGEETEA